MQAKVTRLACKDLSEDRPRISKSKTKVMRINTRNVDYIKLDGEAIDEVEDFHTFVATPVRIVQV